MTEFRISVGFFLFYTELNANDLFDFLFYLFFQQLHQIGANPTYNVVIKPAKVDVWFKGKI